MKQALLGLSQPLVSKLINTGCASLSGFFPSCFQTGVLMGQKAGPLRPGDIHLLLLKIQATMTLKSWDSDGD